jgi:hypothetical protein
LPYIPQSMFWQTGTLCATEPEQAKKLETIASMVTVLIDYSP